MNYLRVGIYYSTHHINEYGLRIVIERFENAAEVENVEAIAGYRGLPSLAASQLDGAHHWARGFFRWLVLVGVDLSCAKNNWLPFSV